MAKSKHNKQLLRLFSATALLMQSVFVLAQEITFFHLSTAQGLSDNLVNSVAKDKNGMLWIATAEGLNSYDGYTVKKYYKEEYPEIGNNDISALFADSNGMIWIRDITGKVVLLDKKGNFTPVPFLKNDNKTASVIFFESPNRGVCVLAGKNIFALAKNKPLRFEKIKSGEDSLLSGGHSIVRRDNSDTMAIVGEGKLTLFDAAKLKILQVINIPQIQGAAWLNSREMLVTTRLVRELLKVSLDKKNLIHNYGYLKDQYGENLTKHLRIIVKLPGGGFVISTAYAGLYFFDAEQEKLHRYDHDPLNIKSISADNTQYIFTDRDGYVYITTRTTGLDYFTTKHPLANYRTSFKETKVGGIYHGYINCIARSSEGNFWLGSQNRLIEWNRKLNTVKFHEYGMNISPGENEDVEIRALCFDKQEKLWVGLSRYGIMVLDKNRKVIKHFTSDTNTAANNIIGNWIKSLTTAPDNKIWVATSAGLSVIDPEKMTVERTPEQSALHKLNKVYCYCVWFRNADEMWIGTSHGAYRYIKSLNSLNHIHTGNGLSSNYVYSFAGDSYGTVYIGTKKGLNLVKGKDVVKIYSRQNGLANDLCCGLMTDFNNNIWVGNDNTLVSYNPADSSFTNYDESAGLNPAGYRPLAYYQSPDGEQWWGSDVGLSYFKPGQLKTFKLPLGVNISSVSAGGINYPFAGNEKLSVPYKNNNLQFIFAAVDLFSSKNILFEYRLSGSDATWQRTNSARQINYGNLSPGYYTFTVRASRDGKNWVEAPGTLTVHVLAPWWRSWWFITAAVLTCIFIAVWLSRSRIKKMVLQKEQLETEKAINYFASSIYEQQTADDILWDVARNCIGRLRFEDCVIYMKDDARNVLVQKAAWGPKTTTGNKIFNPLEIPVGTGIVGSVALSGKAEIISDTSEEERYIVDDVRRYSEITVPIIYNNKVIGIIDSEHSSRNFFRRKHLFILTTIAALCANKIMRSQAEAAKQQAQLELLEHKRKMAEVQLKSLRLQMSPHFLFNALNSIQQIILAGKEAAATRYLSKFSRLLRLVLQHSDREKISLKEEVETLGLYLELESLRFDESFFYTVEYDRSMDADEIKVPTLLVQPFVENAVWHGLLHKEGQRRLAVQFSEDKNDNLICVVEDNGVGRKASGKISKQELHTGKGLSVAEERIKTFNQQHIQKSSFVIEDMYDEMGAAKGTKVIICLPMIK